MEKECLTIPGKKINIAELEFRKKKRLKMEGPDGGWAWLVALSICLINLIFAGIQRMSGILFVAFINTFGIAREEAALPSSIRSSMKNLLGPAVGILGQHYGIRAVTLAGAVVATISAASCYFATNMTLIIALWGCLNGIGVSLTVNLLQVVIGQHFKVHHSTASGLAFSGGCVGSFIFPVLIEYLLNNYGLQGTFLIMSGVIMHAFPAALMLRKPAWLKKTGKGSERRDTIIFTKTSESSNSIAIKDEGKVEPAIVKSDSDHRKSYQWLQQDTMSVSEIVSRLIFLFDVDKELVDVIKIIFWNKTLTPKMPSGESVMDVVNRLLEEMRQLAENPNVKGDYLANNIALPDGPDHNSNQLTARYYFIQRLEELVDFVLEKHVGRLVESVPERLKNENNIKNILLEVRDVCQVNRQIMAGLSNMNFQRNGAIANIDRKNKRKKSLGGNQSVKSAESPVVHKDGFKEHFKTALRLNKNPIYLLICICRTVHFITFIPFVTVVVDFSKDKGLPEDYGKYVLAALSAGDLVGRLGFGWVTDSKLLSLPRYMLIVMVAQGITTATLPLIDSMYPLMAMIALFGMLVGSVFIRHPVLISKYMSTKEKSIAMGSINFFAGIIGFALPTYIGYFRDTLGSYDCMFYITGSITSCAGMLWLFEPQIAKHSPIPVDDDAMHETPPMTKP